MNCLNIRRKKIKGFTLVELLVVISIIAMLLAILMPSLQKARNQAKVVICRSNMHQISLASTMYVQNNDDYYPNLTIKLPNGSYAGGMAGWIGQRGMRGLEPTDPGFVPSYASYYLLTPDLRPFNQYLGGPYTADSEVKAARCPAEPVNPQRKNNFFLSGTSYQQTTHNSPNTHPLVNTQSSDIPRPGVKHLRIKSPSRMVLMTEPGAYYTVGWYRPEFGGSYRGMSIENLQWHRPGKDMFGVAFADGHGDVIEFELNELSTADYTFDTTD